MSSITHRRYSLLRRGGYDHWDAVRLVISWRLWTFICAAGRAEARNEFGIQPVPFQR